MKFSELKLQEMSGKKLGELHVALKFGIKATVECRGLLRTS